MNGKDQVPVIAIIERQWRDRGEEDRGNLRSILGTVMPTGIDMMIVLIICQNGVQYLIKDAMIGECRLMRRKIKYELRSRK